MPKRPSPPAPNALTSVATIPPRTRVRALAFWRREGLFLATVVLGASALLWVYPLALAGVSARIERFVSMVNLALWLWAAADAALALATMNVNQALATCVYRQGEDHLRGLRAANVQRINLDDLLERFVPQNPARPAVTRMVEHILAEARDRQFNFSGNIVRLYREESVHAVAKVERLQQMTLRLGILGTFIGLGMAMQAVPAGIEKLLPETVPTGSAATSTALETSRVAFLDLAQSLVGALGDAFGTSIAGLSCSVSIWAMVHVLRRRQFQHFDAMDRAAEVMTSLARNAEHEDRFHEQFRLLIEHLDQLKLQLYDRVGRLGEDLVTLDGKVTAQATAIDTGLRKLKSAGGNLDSFLERLTTDQTKVLKHLAELFEHAELRTAFTRLEQAIDAAGKKLGTRLEARAEHLLTEASPLVPEIASLSDQLGANVRATEKLEQRLNELGTKLHSIPSSRPPAPSSLPHVSTRAGVSAKVVVGVVLAGAAGSAFTHALERMFQ